MKRWPLIYWIMIAAAVALVISIIALDREVTKLMGG